LGGQTCDPEPGKGTRSAPEGPFEAKRGATLGVGANIHGLPANTRAIAVVAVFLGACWAKQSCSATLVTQRDLAMKPRSIRPAWRGALVLAAVPLERVYQEFAQSR